MHIGQPIFYKKKLTGEEGSILEKAFWKMFLATKDTKVVEDSWLNYFVLTTNMNDDIFKDNEELRKVYRDTMECQLEHELYIKFSNLQLQSDGTDTLQQRI